MELPPKLRLTIDEALDGVPISELSAASDALSQRYRNEVRDGRMHLSEDGAALAYLATRMPATFAAIHASLSETAIAVPGFAPVSLLDAGAGPGTALWAAATCWPGLERADMLEASPVIRSWGERLSKGAGVGEVAWRAHDLRRPLTAKPSDLVVLAYVLDELTQADRGPLIDRLWSLTAGVLVIVEPGTPAGWARILDARARLITAGARIAAPCPHARTCPIVGPDWCHFSARVARSRTHRLAKSAEVPWEDEKYIYLAATRLPAERPGARVIAPPEAASGRVRLKLCQADGAAAHRLVTRREGEVFKRARRIGWGDGFEP
ncbi:MAG TPA: small ribosomal subunit Rsm22 family protein [Hyphomonadaceae bacterium]|nr:small ribosomal subunit Rsm22 family protein [Hyphomonadaceae bacterium]